MPSSTESQYSGICITKDYIQSTTIDCVLCTLKAIMSVMNIASLTVNFLFVMAVSYFYC